MAKSKVNSRTSGRLLSLHEAAAYLALSYWTTRGLIHSGEIPFLQAGRRILIDIEDLNFWIEMNKKRGEFL